MKYQVIYSDSRGSADFGWFKARYTFSFGQYHNPQRMGFGALRVFNDSSIAVGKGFPEHPHENFEIITLQFQGDLEHTDISGTRNIRANMVQAISAGTGVTHSDVNISDKEARQFQIWIQPNVINVLPKSELAQFNTSDWQNKWKVLVGPIEEKQWPLAIYQNAYLSRGAFAKGNEPTYKFKKSGNGIYLMIISGEIQFDEYQLSDRDSIMLSDTLSVSFECITDADILITEVPV